MRIIVDCIPLEQQRYLTEGDWQFFGDDLVVRVSDPCTSIQFYAIAIHEIVEAILCQAAGVSEASVDTFDTSRLESWEPGDLPEAPYHLQHKFATKVEDLLVEEWIANKCKITSQDSGAPPQS